VPEPLNGALERLSGNARCNGGVSSNRSRSRNGVVETAPICVKRMKASMLIAAFAPLDALFTPLPDNQAARQN
jgi:hypothetical protein